MLGTILIVILVLMLLGSSAHCPPGLTAETGAMARAAGWD